MSSDWRKVCERGEPKCEPSCEVDNCAECLFLITDERDRLARFALLLASSHGDCSFISEDERGQSIAELWEQSADAD